MRSDPQFSLLGAVGHQDVEGMPWGVIGSLELKRAVRERRISLLRGPVVNHNLHCLPPRRVRALTRTEIYAHRVPFLLASERLAQKLAMLVSKCMPVIKIERPCAVLSGIDTKFQRPGRGFIGSLDEWMDRRDD